MPKAHLRRSYRIADTIRHCRSKDKTCPGTTALIEGTIPPTLREQVKKATEAAHTVPSTRLLIMGERTHRHSRRHPLDRVIRSKAEVGTRTRIPLKAQGTASHPIIRNSTVHPLPRLVNLLSRPNGPHTLLRRDILRTTPPCTNLQPPSIKQATERSSMGEVLSNTLHHP